MSVSRTPIASPQRGTRPRNRRALIRVAAAELFSARGYPQVSMSDIAEAVAIGPSALYRHFTGKQQLLYEVVLDALDTTRAAVNTAADDRLGNLAATVLDHRALGVLWQRESRHLPPDEREHLRTELVAIADVLTSLAAAARPELDGAAHALLALAVLGALMSVSYQHIQLPRNRLRAPAHPAGDGYHPHHAANPGKPAAGRPRGTDRARVHPRSVTGHRDPAVRRKGLPQRQHQGNRCRRGNRRFRHLSPFPK